jgi:GNAT superfamily N-acetyltransferase
MASIALERKPRLQPVISRISDEDADAAATVQVKAMVSHAVQLRIQPLDNRPPIPVQIQIKAQGFRDMLTAGYHHIIKAVLEGQVVGIADWVLVSNKKAQVHEGTSPALPRERTKQDEEAVEGVDVDFQRQVGMTSSELRNKTMGDAKYWCVAASIVGPQLQLSSRYLSMMVVDPAFQSQGIGKALLQWGLDQADAQSLEVYLESSEDGLRLYEKNGFELIGWNVLTDEKSEGGVLKWPAMKRGVQTA